jgi:predicted nucleic acid-binding protein
MAASKEIVIDTSVIVAVVGDEPERPALIEMTRGARLTAPPSVHWEVGNALSAMLRRKRIDLTQARSAAAAYEKIRIEFVDVSLDEALDLAARLGAYAYDAYLIACARKRRAPLLTLDAGLARRAQAVEVQVLEVGS